MNNLYLIWDIEIIPLDKNVGNIKSKINFKDMKHQALKNKDVYNFFEGKKICPIFNKEQQSYINIYYLDIDIDNYNVQTRFIEITNTMLLTNNINCNIINSAMSRHFINLHDLSSKNDNIFKYRMYKMIELIEKKNYYDLDTINILINTKLYNYQVNNINWMIKREIKQPIYHISSSARLINFPDGRLYNYIDNKFITINDLPLLTIKGGIIADEVGKGKTVQLLSLCYVRNISTLILTPNHLKQHWYNELAKHFTTIPNIFIESFEDFNIEMLLNKQRLIIDEIHLLYSNNSYKGLYKILCSTKIEYKWGLTGTPFVGENTIHKIIQYLTDTTFYYELFERYTYYQDIFISLFKSNVEKNILDELILPPIQYYNHLLTFMNIEKNAYNTEILYQSNLDSLFLRQICCDIMMNIKDIKVISEKEFIQSFLENKVNIYNLEKDKLNHLQLELDRIIQENKSTLIDNIEHYENLIVKQKKIIYDLNRPIQFLNQQLIEEKRCNIGMCLSEDDIKEAYSIFTECNHYFCVSCLESSLKNKKSCPLCRSEKIEYITVSNNNKIQYSTKILKLLEIIKSVNEQFIIYTQFEYIIDKLIVILNKHDISANSFSIFNIELFKNKSLQILILSSKHEACGLDLSFVSNIIIFEPIYDTDIKDIEKQIVGRIYRINQTSKCNIHRLIIKDTIEEDIYNNMGVCHKN